MRSLLLSGAALALSVAGAQAVPLTYDLTLDPLSPNAPEGTVDVSFDAELYEFEGEYSISTGVVTFPVFDPEAGVDMAGILPSALFITPYETFPQDGSGFYDNAFDPDYTGTFDMDLREGGTVDVRLIERVTGFPDADIDVDERFSVVDFEVVGWSDVELTPVPLPASGVLLLAGLGGLGLWRRRAAG